MKRILTLALALTMLAVPFALAAAEGEGEFYVHPAAGYGFAVPEGWLAIDGANVDSILEQAANQDFNDLIRQTLQQLQGMPIVLLYQQDRLDSPFKNNINVTFQDLGAEYDIVEVLSPYAEFFEESLKETFPGYVVTYPMAFGEFGGHMIALTGGEYEIGGFPLSLRQVRLAGGTLLYEISMTVYVGEGETVTDYEEMLLDMIETFYTP